MAKKKWKKRLKKLAKAALIGGALYGGAKLLGRRKSVADTAASEDANIGTNVPILGTDHITPAAPVDTTPKVLSRGDKAKMLARGAMNKVPPSMRGGEAHAEGYQRYMPPNRHWPGGYIGRKGGGIAKRGTGAAYKSGGRVKSMGIAKRGGGAAKR